MFSQAPWPRLPTRRARPRRARTTSGCAGTADRESRAPASPLRRAGESARRDRQAWADRSIRSRDGTWWPRSRRRPPVGQVDGRDRSECGAVAAVDRPLRRRVETGTRQDPETPDLTTSTAPRGSWRGLRYALECSCMTDPGPGPPALDQPPALEHHVRAPASARVVAHREARVVVAHDHRLVPLRHGATRLRSRGGLVNPPEARRGVHGPLKKGEPVSERGE